MTKEWQQTARPHKILSSVLTTSVTLIGGRAEQAYIKIIAKCGNSTPATGNVAREIEKNSDAGDRVEVQQPHFSKPRP